MIISTQTDSFQRNFGEHEAIKMLAKVGFDALDYSMFGILHKDHPLYKDDYKEYAASLRRTADECGIVFNQSHAPFPSYINDPGKTEYNELVILQIIRALEVTSILGGKISIVHPITLKGSSYEEQKNFNIEFYRKIEPYAKKYKVRIALENMWGWNNETRTVTPAACSTCAEFIDYLDTLGNENFTACVDLGHGDMAGSGATTVTLLTELGHGRVGALHVHDNDGIGDLHTLPFVQKLKWQEIMNALKDINYKGDFTFEADNFLSGFPKDLFMNASRLMLEVGKYFIKNYYL